MRLLRALALSGLLALCASPGSVHAQQDDPLVAAERAYSAVDFETQRAEAQRALSAGNADPARLVRIYRLLGIAHAALGETEPAKEAFMRLLAIDPSVELEHVLSPRLRTPYMEARGYWDVASTRLGVDVVRDAANGALLLTLLDPLGMIAHVRVRCEGPVPEPVTEFEAEPELVVTRPMLAAHAGEPLLIELYDEYQNLLATRALAAVPSPRAVAQPPAPAQSAEEHPSLVVPIVLAGGSLLAFGIGATAHIARENHADEWNSSNCERPGLGTRAEQCADVDAARRSAERVAIVAYASGGALLAGSLVSYLLSRSHSRPHSHEAPPSAGLACTAGPTPLGLSCSATF